MMKPYHTLTVRGQARRLRWLALEALRSYDLDLHRIRLVTNDFNGIFRIDTPKKERYVLRVVLPQGGHTPDHLTAEMDWLRALAEETNLSLPRPLPTTKGELFIKASAAGIPEGRFCAVFSWVPGGDLANSLSINNLTRLGELSARLHLHARDYHPPANLDLLRFDRVIPFSDPFILFEQRFQNLVSVERRSLFQAAIDRVQPALDWLIGSGEPMRLIHGDLHQWNVRCWRGLLSPIDFEDLMWGWPVQDIAVTFFHLFDHPHYQEFRAAFTRGYQCLAPWPERYPGEIDSFISARVIGMANFVLQDPNPNWARQSGELLERFDLRLKQLL